MEDELEYSALLICRRPQLKAFALTFRPTDRPFDEKGNSMVSMPLPPGAVSMITPTPPLVGAFASLTKLYELNGITSGPCGEGYLKQALAWIMTSKSSVLIILFPIRNLPSLSVRISMSFRRNSCR